MCEENFANRVSVEEKKRKVEGAISRVVNMVQAVEKDFFTDDILHIVRDISDNSPTGEVKTPDTGISNIDVSKIANPFAKPESSAPEDPKVENENISSSITTEQVSAPAPVAPAAPPVAQAAPASGGSEANSALDSIRALVEPYKQSGVVKDFKEFEFGNYVTLTIRINKGA